MNFLPINKQEMQAQGLGQVDFVYISGDSYVDHPSFGTAIITRVLQHAGYTVAVLPQPNIQDDSQFTQFGTPRLGFMVSAGNVDSMVNHYTVAKKRRSTDFYTAGGEMGKRPDRAVIVYSKIVRRLFPQSAIIIGGVEASLRRFAHYDYWDDKVRPSVLFDSQADLISYGMGETQTVQIADRLAAGENVQSLRDIRGTCYKTSSLIGLEGYVECASFEKVRENKLSFAKAYGIQHGEFDHVRGRCVVQKHGQQFLVQNPPALPLETAQLDQVYSLPYQRTFHPVYAPLGGVPAITEVEFSIIQNRGCFGACNFCAIAVHQGRYITSRSEESLLTEAEAMTHNPRFKGYIHDVGGPTANFRRPSCDDQIKHGLCKTKKCLAPTPCPKLVVEHTEYDQILNKMRKIPGIKKVFIRSGIRFDYLNLEKNPQFMKDLVQHHVSGQLKVAPEHCSIGVLNAMGKPAISAYRKFEKNYYALSEKAGKKQFLVPYLMSSHPGSGLKEAIDLALFLKEKRLKPQQVQDFYPTPFTASTCMYYTGLDPFTLKPVHVVTDPHEKAMQRALIQYFLPQNKQLVIEALKKADRYDLIGHGPNCLIAPDVKTATQMKTSPKNQPHGKPKGKGNAKNWQKRERASNKVTKKR